MRRVVEILAILAIMLLILSIVTMPWPANIGIGFLLLVTFVVIFIYDRRAKKREQDARRFDIHQNRP